MTSSPRRPRARAAALVLAATGVLLDAGCAPPRQRKPVEMAPIGTVPIVPRTVEEPEAATTTTPNSATPSAAKGTACSDDDFEALDEVLKRCESRMPGAGDVPTGMRGRLEIKVSSGTPSITPGGHVELSLTLKNKSSEPLSLYFTGDPSPRFEVEALDGKGRRADLPAGKPPKGAALPGRDVKAARITLAAGGSARVKIPWEAVKTRWAPEKVKTWEGRGYPRVAAGPLAAGKYTLRLVIPLVGIFEKGEIEVPTLPIDVGS